MRRPRIPAIMSLDHRGKRQSARLNLHRTESLEIAKTGIGLAFCRKVVESHGGTNVLHAQPGGGACYKIELPPRAVLSPGNAPTGECHD